MKTANYPEQLSVAPLLLKFIFGKNQRIEAVAFRKSRKRQVIRKKLQYEYFDEREKALLWLFLRRVPDNLPHGLCKGLGVFDPALPG